MRNFLATAIFGTLSWIGCLTLTGCGENPPEDTLIPPGMTDPAELTQLAVQKQEIGAFAFEEAITILKRAVDADPKFVAAHYRMGKVFEDGERKKEAVAAYQKALELAPDHIDARLGLASAYAKSFKNELAIMEYKKAAQLKPDDPGIQFKIALEYWYLQKLPETAEHYRKVIALKPNHLQAHLNLASVYERLKDWDSALREIAISRDLGKRQGNQQAISIAENKLLFLKGRMNLSDKDWERKTSPPFQ